VNENIEVEFCEQFFLCGLKDRPMIFIKGVVPSIIDAHEFSFIVWGSVLCMVPIEGARKYIYANRSQKQA
jgi:hypothetical protein